MHKPVSLRKALNEGVPHIRDKPGSLRIFVDAGNVVATLAPSLSYEYRYTLNLIVTDFAGDQNLLMVPILCWLKKNQPDLMANNELRERGFSFEVDILNHKTCDTGIDLKLTERVAVRKEAETVIVEAVLEPHDPEDWTSA
ncbi:phage tail protein [Sodalis sp. RH15]|uniref:phage tail protein n=1 Tax=Sodalis sp. RH15 TaxID=3394330 RepID=UPI0039B40EDE